MSGPRLRAGDVNDAAVLGQLHAAVFPDAWPDVAFTSLLEHPEVFVLLGSRPEASSEEGFILARVVAGEGEVLTFCVAEAARRCGLGRALLEAACEVARSRGSALMFLEVSERNSSARALYQESGFVEVGRRGAYYRQGSLAADALVMRKQF
jgi:ribosomal-protein-alanine N-acetyltransferase